MGFTWVKQKFPWREIEGIEKGAYDWFRPDFIVAEAEKAGLKLLVRLDQQPYWAEPADNQWQENGPPGDLADFGDFCGAVAARYRGRIGAYQVWNEPNLSREWGNRPPDPVAYTELLRVCYTAIKAADPDAIVVSAGLAPTGTDTAAAMPDRLRMAVLLGAWCGLRYGEPLNASVGCASGCTHSAVSEVKFRLNAQAAGPVHWPVVTAALSPFAANPPAPQAG